MGMQQFFPDALPPSLSPGTELSKTAVIGTSRGDGCRLVDCRAGKLCRTTIFAQSGPQSSQTVRDTIPVGQWNQPVTPTDVLRELLRAADHGNLFAPGGESGQ